MSNSVTDPTNGDAVTATEHVASDKGKGKQIDPAPHAMAQGDEDDEEEDDRIEEDEEDDEGMDEDELADLQEAVEPEERVTPGTRRTRNKVVNYASEEALNAAGLQPEKEGEDDEEDFHETPMEA